MNSTIASMLDARKHFVDRTLNEVEVDDLRAKADVASRVFPSATFLSSLRRDHFYEIPLFTFDDDESKWLGLNRTLSGSTSTDVVAAFEIPKPFRWSDPNGDENWQLFLKSLKSTILLRYGFFENEVDVIESVLQGFRGITLFASRLDHFAIQYLTELCRDLRMSCVHIVENKSTLEKVLQTDSPYIGLWGFQPAKPVLDWDNLISMVELIPSQCTVFVYAPALSEQQKSHLKSLGVRAVC